MPREIIVIVVVATCSPSAAMTAVSRTIASLRPTSRISVTVVTPDQHIAGIDRAVEHEAAARRARPGCNPDRARGRRSGCASRRKPSVVRNVGGATRSRWPAALRGGDVVADRVGVTDRQREMTDELATDLEGRVERILPADEGPVERHWRPPEVLDRAATELPGRALETSAAACRRKMRPLAGLAVLRVVVAVGAVLLQVQAIRVVTPVLLGDVVAVLAHRARHRDLRSNVSGLGHGSTFFVS